jgi:hypothetical protein
MEAAILGVAEKLKEYVVIGRCDREVYYLYYYGLLFVISMIYKFSGSKLNITSNSSYKTFHRIYNILLSLISLYLTAEAIKVLLQSGASMKPTDALSSLFCRIYPGVAPASKIFFYVKFIEWFDSVHLLLKSCGNFSSISALHHVHHAIVPNMVCNGYQMNGEMFVIISNSFAHVLMYAYYAFPDELKKWKSIITTIQTTQHFVALVGITYQAINSCDMSYGVLNILGYAFFFIEFLKLLLSSILPKSEKTKRN